MSSIIQSANESPPVEIVIVNYGSKDDLDEYITSVKESKELSVDNKLTYVKYSSDHYHMAKARNLAAFSSSGDYLMTSSTDISLHIDCIRVIRKTLETNQFEFIYPEHMGGIITCKRSEFMSSGGYDNRFEFYSPEDKDLLARLIRRGCRYREVPGNLVKIIRTDNSDKIKNYRLNISKREMHNRMVKIYDENIRNKVLVVNKGVIWEN